MERTGKRKSWGYAGLARLQSRPKSIRLLLSVIRPSVSVSLFFCLGHCYTLLKSRLSPTFAGAVSNDASSSYPFTSSSNLSILKNLSLYCFHLALCLFSACLSILMLSLLSPSTHTLIQYSYFRGHLWVRVHLHHFQCRGNLHFLLKHSPVSLLFLIELIQILVLVSCCSSFFRLKAMCHSLLLSLCLFLHLFLLLPPTQSLSPLPTPFSLLSVDVIVCELPTASVCLFMR